MTSILHVEDDEGIRIRVHDLLSSAGLKVISAINAEEAQVLIATQVFDLIISDSDLPDRFEGLDFILSVLGDFPTQKVVILADKHQFRKISFISKGILSKGDEFVRQCQALLVS